MPATSADAPGSRSLTARHLQHLMRKKPNMHVLKKTAALAATAVVSVALVACGSTASNGPNGGGDTAKSLANKTAFNPQPYDNIKDGGTLTTSLAEISPQFNLRQGDGTAYTRSVWNWYNPLLITFTPTETPSSTRTTS